MRQRWSAVLAVLSVLPPLVAAAAWYWLETAAIESYAGISARPTQVQQWRWVHHLLPPIVLLLPVLPIVLIGRELGRRHREDYSPGIAALGLTVCGVVFLFGLVFDFVHTPRGLLPGAPEWVGRVAEVAVPLIAGMGLGVVGIAAARRRRTERTRRKNWICVSCGYSLLGNPWQCPECGRRYVPGRPPASTPPESRR